MILNLEESWSWEWRVPISFARMICSGRLGGLAWTCIISPLEGVLQIGSGDLFVTQTWINLEEPSGYPAQPGLI